MAIVANMKYVEIEFSNQPVVLPFPKEPIITDEIEDLLSSEDVNREQRISSSTAFDGFLIPPSKVKEIALNVQHKKAKGQILKEFILTDEKDKKMKSVYLQQSRFVLYSNALTVVK